MPNSMRDKVEDTWRGGRREETCDHGVSRRSLKANPYEWSGKEKSDDKKRKQSPFLRRSQAGVPKFVNASCS